VLETKRVFNPGEGVMDFQGQRGLVLSPDKRYFGP
jgi:hypothetical protein